jgi:hypothetical protein
VANTDIKKFKIVSFLFFKIRLKERAHSINAWFFSRMYSRSLFHFIGDSHVSAYSKGRYFLTHHIGPATAYKLASSSSTTHSYEKLFLELRKINKKRDVVVLVFGEVDCRMHIYKQFVKNHSAISIAELIDKTISRYKCALKQVDDAGYNFLVYGIVPAATQENIWNTDFYPDGKIRLIINREFNEQLKIYCAKNSYRFLDVQSKFADESGFISKYFSTDGLHLNQNVLPIMNELLNVKAGSMSKQAALERKL